MIEHVPHETLDEVWARFKPKIERALKFGEGANTSSEHLYEEVKAGRMFMIVVNSGESLEACGIISIQKHPARKTIFVELLAGHNLKSWINEAQDMLLKLKEHYGAEAVEASCRPGLVRLLKSWKTSSVIMELT